MRIDDHNGKRIFNTPEGYFEQLEKEIAKATVGNTGHIPAKRGRTITANWRNWAGYAAMIAAIVTIALATTGKGDGERRLNAQTAQETQQANAATFADSYDIDSEYIDMMLTSYPIDEYTFYTYLTETE